MIKPIRQPYRSRTVQFNLMPLIDVVFLLIVFFMLICQFISRENYRLEIPQNCANALTPEQADRDTLTVSVFYSDPAALTNSQTPGSADSDGASIRFAVRNRQFDPHAAPYQDHPDQMIDDLAKQIEIQSRQKGKSLVQLRADKDLPYGQVQKSLIALSRARIHKVRLAAQRNGQTNHQQTASIE